MDDDYHWYDLRLPDGTQLLAYDPEAALDAHALRLEVTLEAASAELLAESGLFGFLHVPDHAELELRLTLFMRKLEPGLARALGAEGADLVEVLESPVGASAHDLGAFELDEAVATIPTF